MYNEEIEHDLHCYGHDSHYVNKVDPYDPHCDEEEDYFDYDLTEWEY